MPENGPWKPSTALETVEDGPYHGRLSDAPTEVFAWQESSTAKAVSALGSQERLLSRGAPDRSARMASIASRNANALWRLLPCSDALSPAHATPFTESDGPVDAT